MKRPWLFFRTFLGLLSTSCALLVPSLTNADSELGTGNGMRRGAAQVSSTQVTSSEQVSLTFDFLKRYLRYRATKPAPNVNSTTTGSLSVRKAAPAKSTVVPNERNAPVTGSSTVNAQDLYWMEHVIHAEADGQPLEAQIAVGDTVLHRMQSPDYPNSVRGVLFQKSGGHYQFTCVANGFIFTQPSPTSIRAALAVLVKHADIVPGAYVFYNPSQTPKSSWVWQQPTIAHIGDFIFAR